jgi:hypothetical protein
MASLSGRGHLGSGPNLFQGSEAFDIMPTDTTMDICGSTANLSLCGARRLLLEAINIQTKPGLENDIAHGVATARLDLNVKK